MGVVLAWNSSASVNAGSTTIPINAGQALGPRSGDVSSLSVSTPVGAPIYVLVWGSQTGATPSFNIPAGWTQLHSYFSPVGVGGACAQLLKKTYVGGMADPTIGGVSISIQAVSMVPVIFGSGSLEVGSNSWGTPAVPGVAGLTQLTSVGSPHHPITTGILIGRTSGQADFRDSSGVSPHLYGDPYLNTSSNRGVVAGWNYADVASVPAVAPSFWIGPGSGGAAEFVAYGVAFSDSLLPDSYPAHLLTDAIRAKPEYRPLTYESGGGIILV